ncbi:MAG: hypothetical protein ACRDJS_04445 [Actinomycetota bacterium]
MRKNEVCPHCGRREAAEIAYGLPDDEGVAAAMRGEIVLGGCVVAPDDPTDQCRSCGSTWAIGPDVGASAISEKFAEYFRNWDIRLPLGAEDARSRGEIHKAGWFIRYRFDFEGGEKFLEFYATHRMTNYRRLRIYDSGRTESKDAIHSFMVAGREEEYRAHNHRVAQELRQLGLYPEGDINAYLRTDDGPKP